MNWTQEPWFTNLPPNTQQDIINQYQNGALNDNDISKYRLIYKPKPQPTNRPMNALDRLAFKPLAAAATVGNKGGSIADVMGAGAVGAAKEVKNTAEDALKMLLNPFFNTFEQKFFKAPISSVNKETKFPSNIASYGHLFVFYTIFNYLLDIESQGFDFSHPTVQATLLEEVRKEYNTYAPIMAGIIWDVELPGGFLGSLASTAVSTMFYTTKKILQSKGYQSSDILIPSIIEMGNKYINSQYITSAGSTFNLSLFGGSIKGNTISFDSKKLNESTTQQMEIDLMDGITAIRDLTIRELKQNVKGAFTEQQPALGEGVETPVQNNPAINTLNNQTKTQSTPAPSSQASTETNSTLSPTTSGFGGLGSAEAGQQKFYDLLGQAGAKYGLDSTTLTNMGFGGPQEKSPAEMAGIPKEQWSQYNKEIEALNKKFMPQQSQQNNGNNIDDLMSGISQ